MSDTSHAGSASSISPAAGEPPANDFDIAKDVCEKLGRLPPDRQQRVIRWVSEILGPHISIDVQPRPTSRASAAGTTGDVRGQASSGSWPDIKSFMSAKQPKSDNQFAAAVAYYYRFETQPSDRKDSIDAQVLQDATRLSGRRRIVDPGKTLRNAAAQGYLDQAERGLFIINSVGENLVAMTLPGGASKKEQIARRKGKQT
jgi:hypothetical protein